MKFNSAAQLQNREPLNLTERIALLDRQPSIDLVQESGGFLLDPNLRGHGPFNPNPRTVASEHAVALSQIDQWLKSERRFGKLSKDENNGSDRYDEDGDDFTPCSSQDRTQVSPKAKHTRRDYRRVNEPVRSRAAVSKPRECRDALGETVVRRSRRQQDKIIAQRKMMVKLQAELYQLQQVLGAVEIECTEAGEETPSIKQEAIQ